MGRRLIGLLSFLGLISASALAQSYDWTLSVLGRCNFTTTSRIYPSPDAGTNELRTLNTPYNSILSGGLEIRAKWLDESYFFYLSSEYLSESQTELKLDGSLIPPQQVPVEDGYLVIPIETGMQVYVPIGSRSWRLSMGGGVGMYYTERILRVAGVSASPTGNRFGFGIHVSIYSEYNIFPGISVAASLKFRDPEVDVHNHFEVPTTIFNGNLVTFPTGDVHSRINVDGMTFGLGILVELR